jgi:membrane protease YdiL (CAAX protease family)
MIGAERVDRPALERLDTVAAVVGITAIGVGFSWLRVEVGLDHATYGIALASFVALFGLAVLLAFAARLGTAGLGLTRPRWLPLAAGVGLSSVVLIGAALLTGPVTHVPSWMTVVSGLLFFTIGTAPAEELLFRGVLFGLVESHLGPAAAVGVTAVSFALAHVPVYGWSSFGTAVCAGLVFGWLRWWSGSLAAPVVAHVVADMALLWL